MEIGAEWGSAGLAASIVAAISGYVILKARLGHEQRINAEGALIASGPQIIAALNITLSSRDKRIENLEARNRELWEEIQKEAQLSRSCEERCAMLTRRIEALEKNRDTP
jgi:predicted RNase H-like nuclease (RuvC/YqgF family)